jgi:hypothetical protein
MATFLDIGLLQHFSVIFPFIFVFALVFAILEFIKPFGKETDRGIHSLIAVCVAGMLLFSPKLIEVINFMTPWFTLLLIVALFTLMIFRFLGTPEQRVIDVMSNWDTIHWFLLTFAIIIVIAALGSVYGPQLASLSAGGNATQEIANVTARQPQNFGENVFAILFHPKVVGLIFILLIASFTIRVIAGGGHK